MGSFLALTYGTIGAMEQAWKTLKLGQSVDRDQFRNYWPSLFAASAQLHLWAGDLPSARKASDESYQNLKPVGSLHIGDQVLIADAEIALAEGRPEHALKRLDELLKLAEQAGRRAFVPEALMFRALSLSAQGEAEGAQENLRRARQEAEDIGSGRILWRILLEQSRLEAASGSAARAAELGTEAKAAVSDLIESLSDPELRQSFQALPDIKEALAS